MFVHLGLESISVDKIYILLSLKVLEIHWISISKEAWKIDYEKESHKSQFSMLKSWHAKFILAFFYIKLFYSKKEGNFFIGSIEWKFIAANHVFTKSRSHDLLSNIINFSKKNLFYFKKLA